MSRHATANANFLIVSSVKAEPMALSKCDRYLLRVAADGELDTSYTEFSDKTTKKHVESLQRRTLLRRVGTGYELTDKSIQLQLFGELKGGRASDCVS